MRVSVFFLTLICFATFMAVQGDQPSVQDQSMHVFPIDETLSDMVVPESSAEDDILLEATKKVPFRDTPLGNLTDHEDGVHHKKPKGNATKVGPAPEFPWKVFHMPFPQFPPPIIPPYTAPKVDDEDDLKPAKKNSVGCDENKGCNPVSTGACKDEESKLYCEDIVSMGSCDDAYEQKVCMASCNACPTGVKPATWESSYVGPGGHYYLGPNRRRVGAGFGRRRALKVPKAEKKFLTKSQVRKMAHPHVGTKVLRESPNPVIRGGAAPADGKIPKQLVKHHTKPQPAPTPVPPLPTPIRHNHVSQIAIHKQEKKVAKAETKEMTKGMPHEVREAVTPPTPAPTPTPPSPPAKPFVYEDATEKAAKWAKRKADTVAKDEDIKTSLIQEDVSEEDRTD